MKNPKVSSGVLELGRLADTNKPPVDSGLTAFPVEDSGEIDGNGVLIRPGEMFTGSRNGRAKHGTPGQRSTVGGETRLDSEKTAFDKGPAPQFVNNLSR